MFSLGLAVNHLVLVYALSIISECGEVLVMIRVSDIVESISTEPKETIGLLSVKVTGIEFNKLDTDRYHTPSLVPAYRIAPLATTEPMETFDMPWFTDVQIPPLSTDRYMAPAVANKY